MESRRPSLSFFIILGMMAMLPPLAIDMYLPSFLDIARDLAVSQEKVQTTLAVFTLGFGQGNYSGDRWQTALGGKSLF